MPRAGAFLLLALHTAQHVMAHHASAAPRHTEGSRRSYSDLWNCIELRQNARRAPERARHSLIHSVSLTASR